MTIRWSQNLLLAATASLALTGPAAASPDQEALQRLAAAAPVMAVQDSYPEINPDLLDPGIADDPAAQKRIIDEAAKNNAIGGPYFDGYGLTRDAAYAFTSMRNNGELPGATDGQSAADWWREAEPKIIERVQDNKLGNSIGIGIAVLGLIGMGAAAARGNFTGLEGGDQKPGAKQDRKPTPPQPLRRLPM